MDYDKVQETISLLYQPNLAQDITDTARKVMIEMLQTLQNKDLEIDNLNSLLSDAYDHMSDYNG